MRHRAAATGPDHYTLVAVVLCLVVVNAVSGGAARALGERVLAVRALDSVRTPIVEATVTLGTLSASGEIGVLEGVTDGDGFVRFQLPDDVVAVEGVLIAHSGYEPKRIVGARLPSDEEGFVGVFELRRRSNGHVVVSEQSVDDPSGDHLFEITGLLNGTGFFDIPLTVEVDRQTAIYNHKLTNLSTAEAERWQRLLELLNNEPSSNSRRVYEGGNAAAGTIDDHWRRREFQATSSRRGDRLPEGRVQTEDGAVHSVAAPAQTSFSLQAAGLASGTPALFETVYDLDGELEGFTITPLPGAIPSGASLDLAETMDREGWTGLFYDHSSERFFELDAEGQARQPGGFAAAGSGRILGSLFGGLEMQAAPLPDGGTQVFSSRSSVPVELFDFTCRSGESRLFVDLYDGEGQHVWAYPIGPPTPGSFGSGGCHPTHTQATADIEYGESWGIVFQNGEELFLSTRASALGAEPRLYSLGEQPAALDGLFRWKAGVWGDPDSGAFLFDVPNGPSYEGSEDGEALGFAPWPIEDVAFELPLLQQGELLTHALVPDLAGGLWRVGIFDRGQLEGTATPTPTSARLASEAAAVDPVLAEVLLSGCLDTDTTLCANHNRFAVTARYRTADGQEGRAHARPLSNDSGTFWFFERDNRELIVKVLDTCALNGHFWFFAAGLTDVEVVLEVWNLETGVARVYFSPQGRPFAPILDTEALECTPGDLARAGRASGASAPRIARTIRAAGVDGTECGGAPEDLCLQDGRFRVEVDFTDFAGNTESAFGGRLTADTGALFFFDPANVEVLIKVLDACVLGNYWVFAAGLTNVGVELVVTDTVTGQTRTYTNPVGRDFQAITDTGTFGCS